MFASLARMSGGVRGAGAGRPRLRDEHSRAGALALGPRVGEVSP